MLLWDEVSGDDGREYLLVAPMPAKGDAAAEPSFYAALRRLEAARTAHEDERVLYVAATRAIRQLQLVGVARLDADKPGGVKLPPAGSLLRRLWPGLAEHVFAEAAASHQPVSPARLDVDPAAFTPPLLRLSEPQVPRELQSLPSESPLLDNPPAHEALPETLTLEAAVGTLVHRCLELWAGQDLGAWGAARIAAQQPVYQRWLSARDQGSDAAARGAAEVVAALQATLASETGCWLLAAHPEGGAEQAWSSRAGDDPRAAVNHVIDRIFMADGCRWIIDYKTVRVPAEDLPALAEQFRPQLERYASLFASDPWPLRLAIFFPLQARLVELPCGQLGC